MMLIPPVERPTMERRDDQKGGTTPGETTGEVGGQGGSIRDLFHEDAQVLAPYWAPGVLRFTLA